MNQKPTCAVLTISRGPLIADEEGRSWLFEISRLTGMIDKGYSASANHSRQVYSVVESPLCIYRDLNRPLHEESLCYVGRVDGDAHNKTKRLVLFFAKINHPSIIICSWQHRLEDPANPGHPIYAARDFGACIYP